MKCCWGDLMGGKAIGIEAGVEVELERELVLVLEAKGVDEVEEDEVGEDIKEET